ncbi:MAG: DUF5368 family protein [Alphaproteobacteria bacterium]
MKELDPVVLFWVVQEYLGAWLWGLLAALVLWLLLLAVACRRAPALGAWRAPLVVGALTAIAATALAPWLTNSGWAMMNGALDWIVLALIALGAGIAAALGFYPLARLLRL